MSFVTRELVLWNYRQGKAAIWKLLPEIAEALRQGCQLELVVRLMRRSCPQNRKLHAMFGDIAASGWVFMGQRLDREDVKRLMVDAFHRETRNHPEFKDLWASIGSPRTMPSLDGTGVVTVGMPTRLFPKPLASAFIDYLGAWMVDQGIEQLDGEQSEWKEAACSSEAMAA